MGAGNVTSVSQACVACASDTSPPETSSQALIVLFKKDFNNGLTVINSFLVPQGEVGLL